MKILLAAGGTGGHIFPALAVALEIQKQYSDISLLWIGTSRSREKELCDRHNISLKILDVSGINRKPNLTNVKALIKFIKAIFYMRSFFRKNPVDAVIAFGGYVCAPVLSAARKNRIPCFLQEQNSVPGFVNRMYSSSAICTFLGYPIEGKWKLKGKTELTGTPIRLIESDYKTFNYPKEVDITLQTILICGGSQGAASMNDCLIEPVKNLSRKGIQVVWQTGNYSYENLKKEFSKYQNVCIRKSFMDLYPFYAISNLVVCRSGASTLNEISYFGLPCIMIPLPWSAENHQWMNAEFVERQGWGIRVAQDKTCSKNTLDAIELLFEDKKKYETMCQYALDSSPEKAATEIVKKILGEVKK